MSHLDMRQFICLTDNYGVIVHDPKTGATVSIDAPDAAAIEDQLRKFGRQLTHIWVTHHHADHVQGIAELKDMYRCTVIGPRAEADKIPGLDITVAGGETFQLAGRAVKVFDCPGHTAGHIAYHIPEEYSLFAGDTLFAMGCGRVIEGTMEQMFHSVNQFRSLSPSTYVYCGHEYTEANARFALSVDAGNRALHSRAKLVASQRAKGEMTCPTLLGDELKTNPFLRCDNAEIRKLLGLEEASDAEVFAELRTRKNNFR